MHGGKIVISGASGLIGTALCRSLTRAGYEVVRLVRRGVAGADEHQWHPGQRPLNPEVLKGARAVVNLSGASIGTLPWTRSYRQTLITSRLDTTGTLAQALARLEDAPHFVSASAVGYYGSRPGEELVETSGPGTTFLAKLCQRWETAAEGANTRVACLRTAPVLHPNGVLKPIIPLTRLGLSGPLGGGHQYWGWISVVDEVRAIVHIIDRELEGPFNLSGPTPATANDIGRAVARKLSRPFVVPAPAWSVRSILGADAADSLVLADARVQPARLLETGFSFQHETVDAAVAAAL